MFEINIALSDTKYMSERQVYTIFVMIGVIGGFNALVTILPAFILAQYNSCMYTSSIQEEIQRRRKNRNQLNQ